MAGRAHFAKRGAANIPGREIAGEFIGAGARAVVDGDGGPHVGEGGGRGATGAAGADDADAHAAQCLRFCAQHIKRGLQNGIVIRVGRSQAQTLLGVPRNGERVDGPDLLGQRVNRGPDLAGVAKRIFFMWQRDGKARQVQRDEAEPSFHEGLEALVTRLNQQGQIDAVMVHGIKRGVVNVRAAAVTDRMADDAVDLGGSPDRVPAIATLEDFNRNLPVGGGFGVVEAGEGEICAELFCKYPAGLTGLTHAEHDARLGCFAQEFEGLDVVANAACPPDDFYKLGAAQTHFREEIQQITGT